MSRSRLFAIVGAGAFAALALWVVWSGSPSPPDMALPHPNGYQDFVKAGLLLTEHTNDVRALPHDDLQAYVRSNAEAFKLFRVGLGRKSRVPIEYSIDYIQTHLPELPALKRLALSLAAEGRLAGMEAHTNEATSIYLDIVRLGHEAARGGLLIDKLVGIACEGIGRQALQDLLPNLDLRSCRETGKALEEIDAKAETTEDILTHEREWSRRTYGWRMRLVTLLTSARTLLPAIQKSEQRLKDSQRQRRLLMIDLAARAYELEKGERPKRLSDLVPAYLKAVPQDPNTRTNLKL